MAKEMMIVFVYDTECCQDEADDPVDAVLYFHPSWVSDTQKLSLCGQIMGTAHFLRETFGKPKVIALQNGKFVLKEFGRFVLAVGTDRNIAQSILEHRAELLSSLLKLFHRDIQTIHEQFSASGQYKNLSEKLYHIFETYLPILQYNGNIFQNMPISKLPKSASNIFLEAMHTLQSCQRTKGILGGSILYHNKVIATQLYSTLAKNLILTDPYRIKSTGESIPVNFHVPVGCQLITAFIPMREYKELCENAERIQAMTNQNYMNSSAMNNNNINNNNNNNNSAATKNNSNLNNNNNCNNAINTNGTNTNSANINNSAAYPFHFKKKLMKRDKSIVFTNIPEEGGNVNAKTDGAPASGCDNMMDDIDGSGASCSIKATRGPAATATVRPNHLPLRFKNITAKDIPESGFSSSITFDEQDSFPQFIGRTSVCSTPMTENKVLHGNIAPICANAFAEKLPSPNGKADEQRVSTPDDADNAAAHSDEPDYKFGGDKQQLIQFDNDFNNFAVNPFTAQMRRNSLIDIRDSFKKISRHLSIRPIDTTKFLNENDFLTNGNGHYVDAPLNNCMHNSTYDNESEFIDDVDTKKKYRTITDPMYPVFNSFGIPISRYLFEEFLSQQYDIDRLIAKNSNASNATITAKSDEKKFSNATDTAPSHLNNKNEPLVMVKPPEKLALHVNNINRKSLSLPLKSLANSDGKATTTAANALDTSNGNIFDKPEQRRKLTGIQLTPLITKLSILAMNDERSSGFSSWDTTPGIELATPLDGSKLFRRRSSIKADDADVVGMKVPANMKLDTDDSEMKKVELFICGQNNMTLLLLMDDGIGEHQEIVHSMFDICVSKLPRLEANLNQILNVNMNADKTDGGYSFFYIDRDWDTLDRCGPWTNHDLTSIEYVRHEFEQNPHLYNLIIRGDDSVIYGHQSIGSTVFYKQSAQTHHGLPPPADAMGTIPKHAKRHLEHDHSIILF